MYSYARQIEIKIFKKHLHFDFIFLEVNLWLLLTLLSHFLLSFFCEEITNLKNNQWFYSVACGLMHYLSVKQIVKLSWGENIHLC